MVQSKILAHGLTALASYNAHQAAAATIPEGTSLNPRALPGAIPDSCKFPVGRSSFGYIDESEVSGHDNCVGWTSGGLPNCKNPWTGQDLSDALSASSQQLLKDGQLQTTTVGRWTASFGLFTTAFSYTNPISFFKVIQDQQKPEVGGSGAGAQEWHYLDQGNYMLLLTQSCPEGG